MAVFTCRLYPVAVDLLHRLDVLRRCRLCCAIGAGICYGLLRPHDRYGWLVVGAATSCSHWPDPANYVDC